MGSVTYRASESGQKGDKMKKTNKSVPASIPTVQSDPSVQKQIFALQLYEKGLLSPYTTMKELGFDPDLETERKRFDATQKIVLQPRTIGESTNNTEHVQMVFQLLENVRRNIEVLTKTIPNLQGIADSEKIEASRTFAIIIDSITENTGKLNALTDLVFRDIVAKEQDKSVNT